MTGPVVAISLLFSSISTVHGSAAPLLAPSFAPSLIPSESPGVQTCNSSLWNDVIEICDTCKAAVNRLNTFYHSCNAYCAAQQGGLRCKGAWEEVSNNCQIDFPISCFTEFGLDSGLTTSDAICECEENSGPAPTASPNVYGCNIDEFQHVHAVCSRSNCTVVVGDLVANGYTSCDAYCAVQPTSLGCSGAWDNVRETCEVANVIDCSTRLLGRNKVICSCSGATINPNEEEMDNAVVYVVISVVVIALVIIASIIFCWWRFCNPAKQRRNHQESELGEYDAKERLPKDIDIFSEIFGKTLDQWHDLFRRFVVRMKYSEQLRQDLQSHRKNWKKQLFEFLTVTLANEEDMQVADENNGKLVSMKLRIATLAMTVLSAIDIEDIFPESGRLPKVKTLHRISTSLELISETCVYGRASDEISIKCLLLYTLVSRLNHVMFGQNPVISKTNLQSSQWMRIIELVAVCTKTVITKDRQHSVILQSVSGRFVSEKLIYALNEFLSKAVKQLPEHINSMKEIGGISGKILIDSRMEKLQRYSNVYQALSEFVATTDRKVKRERKMRRSSKKHEAAKLETSLQERHTDMSAKLAENLLAINVGTTKAAITDGLKFSEMKLKHEKKLETMQELVVSVSTIDRKDAELRVLLKEQVKELNAQIEAKNCFNSFLGTYRCTMSGVLVTVKTLRVRVLDSRLLSGLLLHQKLCLSPYVLQIFGTGFSNEHGWFVCMEHVERSLSDIIHARQPPSIVRRAKLAFDIAKGFEFLHKSGVHHQDISPNCIMVTNTFGIKITDFQLAEHVGGIETLRTLQRTSSIASTPVYVAPEKHVHMGLESSSTDRKKMDVFSVGVVLLELLSTNRQRVQNIVPRDLASYYRQRSSKTGGTLSGSTGHGTRHSENNDISSTSEEWSKTQSLDLGSEKEYKVERENQVLALPIEEFALPRELESAIAETLCIDPSARPTMSQFQSSLSRSYKELEIAHNQQAAEAEIREGKGAGIKCMSPEEVAEVNQSLHISNLIEGSHTVYRLILFGVQVAVKVFGETTMSKQFVEELKIMQKAGLTSEGVVQLYGCGFSKKFGWFLCMEYVGNNLAEICFRDPPVSMNIRMWIAQSLGRSFAALHNIGIHHRDIKPLNVLITSDFNVKISDFGISVDTTASPVDDKKKLVGTPFYMAPEHFVGDIADTAKADVFAMGVLLLELFSGCPISSILPSSSMLRGFYDNRRQQLKHNQGKEDLTKTSRDLAFDLGETEGKIDEGMSAIICKCLAFDATRRPSMKELSHMLDKLTKGSSPSVSKRQARPSTSTGLSTSKISLSGDLSHSLFDSEIRHQLNDEPKAALLPKKL